MPKLTFRRPGTLFELDFLLQLLRQAVRVVYRFKHSYSQKCNYKQSRFPCQARLLRILSIVGTTRRQTI